MSGVLGRLSIAFWVANRFRTARPAGGLPGGPRGAKTDATGGSSVSSGCADPSARPTGSCEAKSFRWFFVANSSKSTLPGVVAFSCSRVLTRRVKQQGQPRTILLETLDPCRKIQSSARVFCRWFSRCPKMEPKEKAGVLMFDVR